jgi:5-methyltetrahydropteroyltriglutamate--homocysteine methyltransferase
MTSTAPGDIVFAAPNIYYKTEEEYLYAIAEAMKEEYHAIIDAGLVLQIDDPLISGYWDLMLAQGVDIPAYHRYCEARLEALNHALAGIPEDRIRYHICWGSHHGPHMSDIPVKDVIPLLLKVRASAWLFEAANARHEHEWPVWKDVKLPEDKVLIPGVIGHSTNHVEHPELVAWRIRLFAETVGKERVIAGTDCGMGYRVHPHIAWAKLGALGEGARIASKELWA